MDQLLIFIKKLIPAVLFKKLQPGYHYVLNFLAALVYGFPSEKLIVVGVTGTTGKTTVVYMIAQMLQNAGVTVGYTSTAMFGDGEREWLNDKKMTMVGRFFTQKMLRRMVSNGCRVAIVETTSEGAVQFRHCFINYDIFVFTGLYPEHIESHGSFDNYKNAKLSLFKHLEQSKTKEIIPPQFPFTKGDVEHSSLEKGNAEERLPEQKKANLSGVILHLFQNPTYSTKTLNHVRDGGRNIMPKTIIVNGDDEHASDFLDFNVPYKIIFTKKKNLCHSELVSESHILPYSYKETNPKGVAMSFDGAAVQLQLLGDFTATNAAAVGSVGKALGLSDERIKLGLENITGIPGRLEKIINGRGATIIVDYAFEPVAFGKLYETITPLHPRKIIHVFGAAGGGRDTKRRGVTGKIAGEKASAVIVTDEDPYDDNPREIMDMVAGGARSVGKKDGEDLFLIEDRRAAIHKALSLAEQGDVVLVTGKGSEQAIVVADGKKIPWDDRKVVKEELERL